MKGLSTGGIKNFSRAVDDPQEMVQLISGQSNEGLYRGSGIELSFKKAGVFQSRRLPPAEGTCRQRGIPKVRVLQ